MNEFESDSQGFTTVINGITTINGTQYICQRFSEKYRINVVIPIKLLSDQFYKIIKGKECWVISLHHIKYLIFSFYK